MKLTNRDKLLLIILAVVVLIFGGYTWGYKPLNRQKETLAREVQNLKNEYNVLMMQQANKTKILNEIETFKVDIKDFQQVLPNNLTQERVLTLIHDMEHFTGIKVNAVSFSPEETIFTGERNERALRVGTNLSYEASYQQLKTFLKYLEEDKERVVIDTISVGVEEGFTLSGTIALSFYGLQTLDVEVKDHTVPNIPLGKDTIITPFSLTGGTSQDTSDAGNGSQVGTTQNIFAMLNPITADLPTVVLGRSNDTTESTYVTYNNNSETAITVEFTQQGDRYFVRYRTSTQSYPINYTPVEINPGNKLEFRVTSRPRVSAEDRSGVNATIINKTDKPLQVVVTNDDPQRPRFKIASQEGEVLIQQ